jgi:hypothetical protein
MGCHTIENFLYISLEAPFLRLLKLKIEESTENLKTVKGSSPCFFLSNRIASSQSQIDAGAQ